MNFLDKIIVFILFSSLLFTVFSGCLTVERDHDKKLIVQILHPSPMSTVLGVVNITGISYSLSKEDIEYVELKIGNDTDWNIANGQTNWSYQWTSYSNENGSKKIYARAWDGNTYSDIDIVKVTLANPLDIEYNTHKWAIFIAAANFPEDEMNKLGNGGLYLAQNMSSFFIEQYTYSTSNVQILFDDGWLRSDGGFGEPIKKLNQIPRKYNVSYGPATKNNVVSTLNDIIIEANQFTDSEVFIWIFNHGFGDYNKELTGGKILERSAIFLWDGYLIDNELGNILNSLESEKSCILIDACYIGGFADRTIYNIPTVPFLQSGIPKPGRVVITSTSKFRTGIAIIQYGPLFSLLWFEGLASGNADGFRSGLLKRGRLPLIQFQDGKVSVEESFFYSRYLLRTVDNIDEFNSMQPQINDQYPNKGFLRSLKGLSLGD